MTEQVEKVARALANHEWSHSEDSTYTEIPEVAWVADREYWLSAAQAAIAATPPDDSVARIVAGLKERERESLNGHVITGIRLWIESGDWR